MTQQKPTRAGWIAVLATICIWTGFILVSRHGVFVAMVLFTFAVRQLGAQTVALLMAFVPGLSALAAVPLLGEPLSLLALGGLCAVTLGAVLAARAVPGGGPAR